MRYFVDPPPEMEENFVFPCGVCGKRVGKRMRAIKCDLCNYWNHIKCDGVEPTHYELLKTSDDSASHYCKLCKEDIFPFQSIHNENYIASVVNGIEIKEDLNLKINPSPRLRTLFHDLNEQNEETLINCEYYDYSKSIPMSNVKNKSIFHMNIASLSKHKEELEAALSLLDFQFDIIGITETKILKGVTPIISPSLDGYTIVSTPTESTKGGTSIYIKKPLVFDRRDDLENIMYKPKELESVFVELAGKKNQIYGCIYRHPCMDIDDFNEYLKNLLKKVEREKKLVYLMGDFNLDLLQTENNDKIGEYYDILTSHLFVPHITLPTRITSTSKTLIDNIFSNDPNFSTGISGNFTFSISDHLPQFLLLPDELKGPPKKHNILRRKKNFIKEDLVADVINTDWNSVVSPEKMDSNNSLNSFKDTIYKILDKHMPLKKASKKELKLEAKPWITPGILNSIKRRDLLLNKYIKAPDGVLKNELHKQYKILRNKIVALLRLSKNNHYRAYFRSNSTDIKKTWKGIKSIINLRDVSNNLPTSMLINNVNESDPTKIAEGFNNHYASVAKKLQDKIHSNNTNFTKYLSNRVDSNFLFRSADTEEIIRIISSFVNSKASGPNSIPTEVLKLLAPILCFPLKEIINISFATGVYPDKLKLAEIIPVYKNKGDPHLVVNYRPISLLSNINKIFEKLVHERLYCFLEMHECIYELQFGFRTKHSTNHALISLTEMVRNALDNSNFACGIFVDFQKAFDTVDHDILLQKLEHYGIRGLANNWFKSYLSNRKQYVSINGFHSKTLPMDYGVPQGSVLGPLLFLIYINDLHNAIRHSVVHHFADDTNLLYVNKNLKTIQNKVNQDLKSLCTWLRANKISLNASKTELIIFRDPRKKFTSDLKLKIDGKKLIPSSSVKYLGIYLDCHLNWHVHRAELSVKLSRATGMLSKIRYYVSKETLHMVYYGIFSSLLIYGSQVWGQQNAVTKKLQILQNKALRIMYFQPPRTSATPLLKMSNILKINDYINLQNFLLTYRSLKGQLPSSLQGNMNFLEHPHDTRNMGCLQLTRLSSKTINYGSRSITARSIEVWNFINKIHHEQRFLDKSLAVCKKFITKLLLDKY